MLSTVTTNNQSPLVEIGKTKMRLPSKVHTNSKNRITIIDTTTQERISSSDPLLEESMRMNGVELQQLLPRPEAEFEPKDSKPDKLTMARHQAFDKLRLELLNMVLETRRDLQEHSLARAAVSPRSSALSAKLGELTDTEALLKREQAHMERVMSAAENRILRDKEREQAAELQAQAVLAESQRFHELLEKKAKAREAKFEKVRYKTELKRQARVRQSIKEAEDAAERARQLDAAREQKTLNFEEMRATREAVEREKKLAFAHDRAARMKTAREIRLAEERALAQVRRILHCHVTPRHACYSLAQQHGHSVVL
eukprot:SAG11_NODE_1098_length_5875_cov_3.667936_1_plen_313_part_00